MEQHCHEESILPGILICNWFEALNEWKSFRVLRLLILNCR